MSEAVNDDHGSETNEVTEIHPAFRHYGDVKMEGQELERHCRHYLIYEKPVNLSIVGIQEEKHWTETMARRRHIHRREYFPRVGCSELLRRTL